MENDESGVRSVLERYPERNDEISLLWNYLDASLTPSPPLLIYGPSGSGKTSICIAILHKLKVPCAEILCTGYSSSKQLFRAIYNAAASALFPSNSEIYLALNQRVSSADISSSLSSSKTKVANPFGKAIKLSRSKKIFNLSDLCHGLSDLLNLHRSQSGVKTRKVGLYLLLRSLNSADSLEPNLSQRLLNLTEYSIPRMKVLGVTRVCSRIPPSCIPVKFQAYSDTQIQKIITLKAHGELLPQDRSRPDPEIQKQRAAFLALLQDSLPRLVTGTRHLNEIWSSVMILWNKRRRAAPSSSSSSHQDIGRESLQDVLFGLLRRPVVNLRLAGERDKVPELSSLRVDNWMSSLPASTRFLLLAAYIGSKNPMHTDHTTMGEGLKGKRKRPKKASGGEPSEADVEASLLVGEPAGKGGGDPANRPIPLDRIFSIYMFIVSQSGVSVTDEEYISKPSLTAGRFDATSVVRGKRVNSEYGDSHLFATMSSLVSMRLLVHGPSWSLSNPTYFCAIDASMAEDIAKSLSVPLNDILLH